MSSGNQQSAGTTSDHRLWLCVNCTYQNRPSRVMCYCGSPRPPTTTQSKLLMLIYSDPAPRLISAGAFPTSPPDRGTILEPAPENRFTSMRPTEREFPLARSQTQSQSITRNSSGDLPVYQHNESPAPSYSSDRPSYHSTDPRNQQGSSSTDPQNPQRSSSQAPSQRSARSGRPGDSGNSGH